MRFNAQSRVVGKILVSGSLAYDRVMDYKGHFAEHINPKKIHVINLSFAVERLSLSFGGTAGNIAYNLSLLKVPAVVIGNLGKDGIEYKKKLQKQKLDVQNVQVLSDSFTSGAYIITDRSDNQIAGFFAGAMSKTCKLPNSSSKDLAIVSPDSVENMMCLSLHYQKRNTPYIFDPGQTLTSFSGSYLKQGMKGAYLIVGNDYEIDTAMKRAAYIPTQKQVLITTFGEKGSVIQEGAKRFRIPSAKARKIIDPTGAGDAYRAGLIKGMLMGWPWEKTGRLASLVAVHAVEKYGTQNHTFTWENLKRRYFENFKERI